MPKGKGSNNKTTKVGKNEILDFINENETFSIVPKDEEVEDEKTINEVDEEYDDFEIDFGNTKLNLQLTDEDIKNFQKAAGKKPNIFEEYHEENKGNSVLEKEEKKDNKIKVKKEMPKTPDFLLEEDEDEKVLKEASELKDAVKKGYIEEKEFDKEDKELLNKADDIELQQYKNADFDDVEDQAEKDKLVTSNLQKQTELLSKKVDRVVGESTAIKFRTEETIQSIQEKEDEIVSKEKEDEILKQAEEIEKKRGIEIGDNEEVKKDEPTKDEPKKEEPQKGNEGPKQGGENTKATSSKKTTRQYDANGKLILETVEETIIEEKSKNLDEMKVENKGEPEKDAPENDEPDLDEPEVEENQPKLDDMVRDFNKEHGTKYSAKNIDKYLKGKFDACEGESLADQQKNFEKELTTFTKRAYQSMLNKKELQGKELTSLQLDDFNKFSKSLQQHCKEKGLLSKDYKMKDFAGMTPKEIKDAQLEHLDKLPKNQQEKTNAILGQGRKGNIKTMDKLLNEQLDKVPPCNEGAGFDNINTKNALMSLQAAERLHNSRSRANRFFHPINNRRERKMIENGLKKLEEKGYTKQEINQQLSKIDKNSDLITQSYNDQKKEVDKMFEKNSQRFEKQRERERKAEEKKRGEKISVKEADIAKQELNSGAKSKKVELNKEKTMDKEGPQQGPKGK